MTAAVKSLIMGLHTKQSGRGVGGSVEVDGERFW